MKHARVKIRIRPRMVSKKDLNLKYRNKMISRRRRKRIKRMSKTLKRRSRSRISRLTRRLRKAMIKILMIREIQLKPLPNEARQIKPPFNYDFSDHKSQLKLIF